MCPAPTAPCVLSACLYCIVTLVVRACFRFLFAASGVGQPWGLGSSVHTVLVVAGASCVGPWTRVLGALRGTLPAALPCARAVRLVCVCVCVDR